VLILLLLATADDLLLPLLLLNAAICVAHVTCDNKCNQQCHAQQLWKATQHDAASQPVGVQNPCCIP
jgi:hypothetical protein